MHCVAFKLKTQFSHLHYTNIYLCFSFSSSHSLPLPLLHPITCLLPKFKSALSLLVIQLTVLHHSSHPEVSVPGGISSWSIIHLTTTSVWLQGKSLWGKHLIRQAASLNHVLPVGVKSVKITCVQNETLSLSVILSCCLSWLNYIRAVIGCCLLTSTVGEYISLHHPASWTLLTWRSIKQTINWCTFIWYIQW